MSDTAIAVQHGTEFEPGDRVRLNEIGKMRYPQRADAEGLIVRVRDPETVVLRWDGSRGSAPLYLVEYLEMVSKAVKPLEVTGDDLVVVASDPNELVAAQHSLIEHVDRLIAETKGELGDGEKVIEQADKAGIKAPLAALMKRHESRILYLSKVRAALEAGYVMVPNFPGETMAIRVKRAGPRKVLVSSQWERSAEPRAQQPDSLPAGEGRYVDSIPFRDKWSDTEKNSDGKEITKWHAMATRFDEEVAMPVDFCKPVVIQRTSEALERKIFDELALSTAPAGYTGTSGRGDPMVLGRVIDKRNRRMLTFLVAWFMDARTI